MPTDGRTGGRTRGDDGRYCVDGIGIGHRRRDPTSAGDATGTTSSASTCATPRCSPTSAPPRDARPRSQGSRAERRVPRRVRRLRRGARDRRAARAARPRQLLRQHRDARGPARRARPGRSQPPRSRCRRAAATVAPVDDALVAACLDGDEAHAAAQVGPGGVAYASVKLALATLGPPQRPGVGRRRDPPQRAGARQHAHAADRDDPRRSRDRAADAGDPDAGRALGRTRRDRRRRATGCRRATRRSWSAACSSSTAAPTRSCARTRSEKGTATWNGTTRSTCW